jgi:hypothetical protein
LALEAINKGLESLKSQYRAAGVREFIVEAIIARTNVPSLQLAKKIFPGEGSPAMDTESNTLSLYFHKVIKV